MGVARTNKAGPCLEVGCEKRRYARGFCRQHYLAGAPWPAVTAAERFFAMVDPSGSRDSCWIWTGHVDKKGYGKFWFQRSVSAHRWAYEFLRGDVPAGLMLDHLCENPPCVNPWHLDPVTNLENQKRSKNTFAGRTHCKNGHPLSGDNLYPWSYTQQRMCVTCARRRTREYQQRKQQERKAA